MHLYFLSYFPWTMSQNCVSSILENPSNYLHETSYKYQSTLDDIRSARTITLAFILFELYPFDSVTKSCPLYYLEIVQAIFMKLHININQHANARTITLAFILFELFPLELFPSQNHVCSVT